MFVRGFKARCERAAESYRKELGLEPHAALNPRKLAAHLRVVVLGVEEIPDVPAAALAHLLGPGSHEWSAMTLERDNRQLIVVNTQHSSARQNNDIAHELSHLICAHRPSRVDITGDGLAILQNYDPAQEEEADWMGAALLVPRAGLLAMVARGATVEEMMQFFAVSKELINWRKQTTAVERQLKGRIRYG